VAARGGATCGLRRRPAIPCLLHGGMQAAAARRPSHPNSQPPRDSQNAFKSYVRARDYCTSPKHITSMCLNAVRVAVEMNNFMHVTNYVSKAEQTPGAKVRRAARVVSRVVSRVLVGRAGAVCDTRRRGCLTVARQRAATADACNACSCMEPCAAAWSHVSGCRWWRVCSCMQPCGHV
jgi:hypothetical protein